MHWTIPAAAHAIRNGTLTSRSLLEQCLARIDEMEDRVRAWVLVDRPRAEAEADAADAELRRGYDRGVLHGIAIGIKDIIDVFDWPTACGSRLWEHSFARKDAPVVQRLRRAGAVLIGKTVTTAYASFDPPPTRNPWKLSCTPGGSSSGSAAAVACGMCLAALGSQTGGSITRPASFCGVPACKPSYGYASTEGVLPLAASMDHVGPMARTVEDVSLVLQAIADTSRMVSPRQGVISAAPRFGRLRGMFDRLASEEVFASAGHAMELLRDAGAEVVDLPLPTAFEEVVARHRVVMAVESLAYHRDRFLRRPEDYPPNITQLLTEGLNASASEYARCKEHQTELRKEMKKIFKSVDALIAPATTTPAPDAATTGDPAFNSPWSYTGLPVVSFPIGKSKQGLPLGIQIIGAHRREMDLLRLAEWCEKKIDCQLGDVTLKE